jgi:hypothetical protein
MYKFSILSLLMCALNAQESLYTSTDLGITISPPKWSSDNGLGRNATLFMKGDDIFSPNVNIQLQNIQFKEFVSLTDAQFHDYPMTVIEKKFKNGEIWYEYTGEMQKLPMHWYIRAWEIGSQTIVITGTSTEKLWQTSNFELRKSIESAKNNK